MADKTGIQWTEATWNPLRGCTRVSEGCRNCYAESVAARFSGPGQPYEGLAEKTPSGPRWTNTIRLMGKDILEQPLHWARPRRIFVNSMSDLFHKDVPDSFIDQVFGVMALARQHTFQILTKRPERMLDYMTTLRRDVFVWIEAYNLRPTLVLKNNPPTWPLPNVWLGVSVEDQAAADKRIPQLLRVPAAVRFLSCEPLLGPVDLTNIGGPYVEYHDALTGEYQSSREKKTTAAIDWVIAGGESGTNARPMHPDWARSLRDQCQQADVAFFFKQWGEYTPVSPVGPGESWPASSVLLPISGLAATGVSASSIPMHRVDKKKAGRELDGRTWDEYPEVTP